MRFSKWIGWAVEVTVICASLTAVLALRSRFERSTVKTLPPTTLASPKTETAPLQVAMVFGRSQGCDSASPELIQLTAQAAQNAKLDPRIFAATVAVESACDPFAVSRSGAVGYAQVMPRVWKGKYDFTGSVNLFNGQDNLRVGSQIMSDLIKQYGVDEGVRRYNGTGVDCATCDGHYTSKILSLARIGGRK